MNSSYLPAPEEPMGSSIDLGSLIGKAQEATQELLKSFCHVRKESMSGLALPPLRGGWSWRGTLPNNLPDHPSGYSARNAKDALFDVRSYAYDSVRLGDGAVYRNRTWSANGPILAYPVPHDRKLLGHIGRVVPLVPPKAGRPPQFLKLTTGPMGSACWGFRSDILEQCQKFLAVCEECFCREVRDARDFLEILRAHLQELEREEKNI